MRYGAVVLTLIAGTAVGASAFDQKRQGLVLGGGLGVGMVVFSQTIEGGGPSSTSPLEYDAAFHTDFKIGYGFDEQVMIYWLSRVSWFGIENIYGYRVTVANSIGGLGLSYYFSPGAGTVYLAAGIGFSSWALPFESDTSAWYGLGGSAGIGYEFSRGWSFEVVAGISNPSDTEAGVKITTHAIGLSFTISGLAY